MNEVAKIFSLVGTVLILLSGLALIFSFNRSKRIAGTLFFYGFIAAIISVVLPSVSSEWIASVLDFIGTLPLWAVVIVGGLLIISALQAFVAMFLGWRAANSFAGNLAATMFRGVFTVLLAPFRLLQRFFGN